MSDFKGIVLTNTLINDSDVIMNVLSEEGKVSIKAKGVLKAHSKNRANTEIGCYSVFHTVEKSNQKVLTLKNTEAVRRFFGIQNDLLRKSIYSCFLEIMNKAEIDFQSGVKYIEYLETCENPYCIYALLLCEVIRSSGISLVVDECVLCLKKNKLYGLSAADGGFVCLECFDPMKHRHLSVEEMKNLRYCMHASLKNYELLEKNTSLTYESVSYLIGFLHRHGDITLKSHAFLEILQPLT